MKRCLIGIMVLTYGLLYVATPALAQDDANKRFLKQGLIGAGTGAIAAEASGGKAGKGALIGAGTSILGNILIDTITESPSQQQPTPQQRDRATKTVDLYQEAYQEGYADGFRDGYDQAMQSMRR